MTNEEIASKMNDALAAAGGLDKSVKFDFGDGGQVFATGTTAEVADKDADCTISVDKADFIALASGDMDPMMAFMSGKLKVAGDMSVAIGGRVWRLPNTPLLCPASFQILKRPKSSCRADAPFRLR
jgi:putative sterol carrier protein